MFWDLSEVHLAVGLDSRSTHLCRDGGGLLPRQAAAKTQQVRRVTPQEGYSTKCSSLSKLWLAAEPWERHPGCGQVKVGLRKQMLVMNEVPLFCYCCIWMLPMGGRWEVLKLRALLQCHSSYMEATKPPLQHGNKANSACRALHGQGLSSSRI